jgi:tRNA(adenine34) deaminase
VAIDGSSSSIDEMWMELALEEARNAERMGEVPIGSVAVFQGAIIGRGSNSKESRRDPTAHAEILALRQAATSLGNWRLIGVTLYATLEPCIMCAGAMIQARLPRLVYGARDIRFGADGSVVDLLSESYFNHRIEITTGILAEESAGILQSFFRSLRQSD